MKVVLPIHPTQGGQIMGLFTSKELDSLDTLLVDQLQDIYDAEKRLVEALPKMAAAAHDSALRAAFEQHLEETKGQIDRLETVFRLIGQEPKGKTCEAMKGLISEGDEVVNAIGDAAVRDAALIAAAQRVEHYEMAAYGSARTFAERLGHLEAARFLQQNLDEEGNADHKLTKLAETFINAEAQHV